MDYSPLWISVQAATFATVITFFTGIAIAWFSLKLKKSAAVVDGIVTLPLVLPPTVVGFFLLLLLGRNSWFGKLLESLGAPVVFTATAPIIAAAVVSLPLMYRTARGAFLELDPSLVQVARTLGIREWTIFWKIVLPNTASSIISGVILSFARALGEFGATIMIAGNIPGKTQTMSVAIYSAVQAGRRDLAYKWVILIAIFSFLAIFFMNLLEYRQHHYRRR